MKELIDQLGKLISNVTISKKFLKKAEKTISKSLAAIASAEEEIVRLQAGGSYTEAIELATLTTKEAGPEIFTQEVQAAVAKNLEFSNPAFLTPLLDIADDEDLYVITIRGNGWNTKAIVNLAMDAVAGTISDYANAVSDTREYLNVGKGDPTKASELWKNYYKGNRAIVNKTIRTRMDFANSPAPFWSLLNYGNKVAMSSDRGGTAYPNMAGTRFVDKVQDRMEEIFNSTMADFRIGNKSRIEKLTKNKDKLKALIDELDSQINFVMNNIEYADKEESPIEITIGTADKKSKELIDIVKSTKLAEGVKKFFKAAGGALSRLFGLGE